MKFGDRCFRSLGYVALFTSKAKASRRWYSPCLLVAELFGDDFAEVQSQPVRHSLGQVMVRAPAKKHDVGHIRGWTEDCFDEEEGEESKEGIMQKKRKGEKDETTGLRLRCWRTGWLSGANVAAGRALHWWCGLVKRRRERSCARQEGKWLSLIGRAASPQELTELPPRFKLNTHSPPI